MHAYSNSCLHFSELWFPYLKNDHVGPHTLKRDWRAEKLIFLNSTTHYFFDKVKKIGLGISFILPLKQNIFIRKVLFIPSYTRKY